jgi:hypothetical protein
MLLRPCFLLLLLIASAHVIHVGAHDAPSRSIRPEGCEGDSGEGGPGKSKHTVWGERKDPGKFFGEAKRLLASKLCGHCNFIRGPANLHTACIVLTFCSRLRVRLCYMCVLLTVLFELLPGIQGLATFNTCYVWL